ncbi:GGDEF domain-containing protein [Salinisphaera hydrothermalis]|uniref:GGDEF domain-containing protein n=1 Tax=Salinisphaera hydrothermalis TaxID=563188 RepID=UPI003340765C
MPRDVSDGRYVHTAVVVMMSLAIFASASATLVNALNPGSHLMDVVVPPLMCLVFAGSLVALVRHPEWLLPVTRLALSASSVALIAPTWLYTVQALTTPGTQLIAILPPISSLLVVLIVMVMFFFPLRQAFCIALLLWLLIALPVLIYLVAHPAEMWTPRGTSLLMTYGPIILMLVVLLPMLSGMHGTIDRLASDRVSMEALINLDPLTKIHNRRVSEQLLKNCIAERIGGGVIMFDLDRFKAINDTYGHAVGDQVLTAVAARCKALLRANECVSRWGGEEFLVVIPGADDVVVRQVAERLRRAIANAPIGAVPRVTASFGVTTIRPDDSPAGVLERADRALYRSKQRGRNRVAVSPALLDGEPMA